MKKALIPVLLVFLLASAISSDLHDSRKSVPSRTLGLPSEALININRIAAWYRNDGLQESDFDDDGLFQGLVYPRGTASAVFSSGLVWGGYVHDGTEPLLTVNGQSYNTGTKPGAILGIQTGLYEDPNSPEVRVWRIRHDYATADLRRDAAETNRIPEEDVTQDLIEQLRLQYETDWENWPWEKGAPYYDLNNNQIMDPDEEPGIAGADQVLWLVCNDLDADPVWTVEETGLELQLTVWGYNNDGPLGDVIYKRSRFIYKGTELTSGSAFIDDFYVSHFSDGDLGWFADDAAGCDTTLDLGYYYNSDNDDPNYAEFGLVPPSLGYQVVQGPVIFTGNQADTAFVDFRKIPGAINLPMTAFMYHATGDAYSDPPFNPSGADQWHCLMQGFPPTPQPPPCPAPPLDPFTGQRLVGPYWGYGASDGHSYPDINNPDGWIDLMQDGPGDRRFIPSSGPFTMALGDTQDIVYAIVGGLGTSHLNSVEVMKANSHISRDTFAQLLNLPAPRMAVEVTLPEGPLATLVIEADASASTPSELSATIKRPDESVVSMELLYDDGTHGDETPGDFVFTTTVDVERDAAPYHLDVSVLYTTGEGFTWENIYSPIVTVGTFTLEDLTHFSDNINDDGEANPGENVRYGFTISYTGIQPLVDVVVSPAGETDWKTRAYGFVLIGFSDSMAYDPENADSYFSADIPVDYTDSDFPIIVGITDSRANLWLDTLMLPVIPFDSPPRTAEIEHTDGLGRGEFAILVLDSASVLNHTYVIEGINEPGGFLGLSLRDSTDSRILLDHHEFPDKFGHNVPVTDGFKLMRGSIEPVGGWDSSYVASGNVVWTQIFANGFLLEGAGGAMGTGLAGWFSGSTLPSSRASDVLIRFAATDQAGDPLDPQDTLVSYAYRYLQNADQPPAKPEFAPHIINAEPGFAFQQFSRSVPFAAYDVSGAEHRRLAVGHLENNVELGAVDGKYWPGHPGTGYNNTTEIGPREWFFIFDNTYSETSDEDLEVDIEDASTPLMYWGTPNRNGDIAFQSGDEFRIVAFYPYHAVDRWVFNPTIVVGVDEPTIPYGFSLSQNYPNPFNPTTTISYSLPVASQVSLVIFDILGQRVRTLIDEVQHAGERAIVWDGKTGDGIQVASGVYFYRMKAMSRAAGSDFIQVRKMVVVK